MKEVIKKLLREGLDSGNEESKVISLDDIKVALNNHDVIKITTGKLIFTKTNLKDGRVVYRMNDSYNVDKWAEYEDEKSFLKAVWQRVSRTNKLGYPNMTNIKYKVEFGWDDLIN